jgi:hypothetical protein
MSLALAQGRERDRNARLATEADQVARAAGDLPRVATLTREIRARGAQQKRRSLALQAASLGLIALGAGAVARLFRRGRREQLQAAASPWSLEDGIGVFIRGDFFNRVYFVALIWISSLPFGAEFAGSIPGELLHTWGTLFASLPLLWLVRHHLLSPDPPRQPSPFGLMPGASRLAGVATICAAAIALDLVGTQAISWGAWGLGVGASWAEGFDEALVFGARSHSVLTTIDYVAWAPAFEELAFRGVLYFSLRQRLGPGSAALASAGVFALLHFYSLPGFLMTLWSGCVWALAFEKTRSLLPGVVAHAVYNGLYVAGLVLLYR